MSDPLELRKTLEADLANLQPRGPSKEITESAIVPGKSKPVPVLFKLTGRQGHRLFYSALCPRCRKGKITAETTLGANGRTVWPAPWPRLCEEICEAALDATWQAAEAERDRQWKAQRRAAS